MIPAARGEVLLMTDIRQPLEKNALRAMVSRLADPAVSPDGKWVAYQTTSVELPSGARNTDLYLVPTAGGEPRRLTLHPKSDSRPRFSPDGSRLGFLSNRDGASQVYVLDLQGGEKPITIGAVYLIFHYTEMLSRPLEQIRTQLQDLQQAGAGIERVQEIPAAGTVGITNIQPGGGTAPRAT